MSRLETLSHDLEGALQANDNLVTFAYNPASQIVSRVASNDLYAWTGHGNGSTTYTVDGLNRTTAYDGTPLGYDPKGNMIFDGVRSFVYDSENRLSNPARSKDGYAWTDGNPSRSLSSGNRSEAVQLSAARPAVVRTPLTRKALGGRTGTRPTVVPFFEGSAAAGSAAGPFRVSSRSD